MQLSPTPTLAGRLGGMIEIGFRFLANLWVWVLSFGPRQENLEDQIDLEMAGAGCQGQEEEFQDAEGQEEEVHDAKIQMEEVHDAKIQMEEVHDAKIQMEEFQDAEVLDEAPADQNQAGQNPEGQGVTEAFKLQIAADQWWIGILCGLILAVITGSITVGIYLSQQSVKGLKLTCPGSCAYPSLVITVSCFAAYVAIALIWWKIIKNKESLRQKLIEAEKAVGQGKQAIAAGGGTGGGQWLKSKKFHVVCFVVGIVFWFVLLSNCWVRVCFRHDVLPESPQ